MIKQQDVTTRRYDNVLFDHFQLTPSNQTIKATNTATNPTILTPIDAKSPAKVEKYSI
jgi:hypothetical protein